jgi:transmembrane sensor
MSNSAEAIEEAAARWFARRESGRWTAADQAEFGRWIEASTAHRIAFIRLDAAWQRAAPLKALGAGIPSGVVPPRDAWGNAPYFAPHLRGAGSQTTSPSPHPSVRVGEMSASPATALDTAICHGSQIRAIRAGRARRFGFAIAFVALVGISVGSYLWPNGAAYQTAVGGLETVPLADGSQVTLNTDSRIRVSLSASERRIELARGEAFFNVAKDVARPFVVATDDMRVVAVGTQFSVRREAEANSIQVVVTEGRVRLERISTTNPRPSVVLYAGSVARAVGTNVIVQERNLSQAEQLLNWRSGYLTFRNITLADAVAEFNRYHPRKIVIEDPAIAGLHVGGKFRLSNVDAFLSLLESGFSGFPIRVERRNDEFVLTGNGVSGLPPHQVTVTGTEPTTPYKN